MQIKVIIPNSGKTTEVLDSRVKMLSQMARLDTVISVEGLNEGPLSVESFYDEVLVGPELVKRCIDAEEKGFDIVVIYCLNDPAIEACRTMVNIPVVGPGEVSMMIASSLGYRFSILTPLDGMISRTNELVKASPVDNSLLSSIRSIQTSVVEIRKDIPNTISKLTAIGKKCIDDDGAHVLLLGCLGFAGMAKDLERELNIPVIDPAFTSIGYSEFLFYQQLNYSKLSYPTSSKGRSC